MPIRSRLDFDGPYRGFFKDRWSYWEAFYNNTIEYVEDEHPSWDGGFFMTQKTKRSGGVINGGDPNPFFQEQFNNVPISTRNVLPLLSLPGGRPPDAQLASKLLALTNPSRPALDMPSILGEFLSEGLPSLRVKGDKLLKLTGDAYLAGSFGFRPIISDLMTSMNFLELVDKRLRTLNNLKKNGKLSYTVELYSNAKRGYTSGYIAHSPPYMDGDLSEHASVRTWGHVKWFPTEYFPTADADMKALAVRAVLGLYHSFSSFWEVIPWSWLIDYFSNVGDLLSSMRNECGLTHSVPQIMDTNRITSNLVLKNGPTWGGFSPLQCVQESKNRATVSASLSASIPILTDGQWSILGALLASKFG